jgi:hypothetical protein
MTLDNFIKIVTPYTMTTSDRIISLYKTLESVRIDNIDGDIVECGVWKGGNILGCMEYSQHYSMNKRIWLYDTFSGMTTSESVDIDYEGKLGKSFEGDCISPLEEVMSILGTSSYPSDKLTYVVGDVCETLLDKNNIPNKISILRLDTDWYSSTKIELEILFPKIVKDGYLIIDDYGHWKGCKKAVDEFFTELGQINDLVRVDYTCVIYKKK